MNLIKTYQFEEQIDDIKGNRVEADSNLPALEGLQVFWISCCKFFGTLQIYEDVTSTKDPKKRCRAWTPEELAQYQWTGKNLLGNALATVLKELSDAQKQEEVVGPKTQPFDATLEEFVNWIKNNPTVFGYLTESTDLVHAKRKKTTRTNDGN